MNNNVYHPAHYMQGKYEVIDFINSHYFPYHLGNAVKYITRAGLKDPSKEVEDLEKAWNYLKMFIENPAIFKNWLYITKRSHINWEKEENGLTTISAEDFTEDKFGDKYPNRSAAITLITSSMYAPDPLEAYLDIKGAIECVKTEMDEVLDRIDGRTKRNTESNYKQKKKLSESHWDTIDSDAGACFQG